MEYGAFDLLTARRDGEGNRWQYQYDKDTLALCCVINPQGEVYQYIFNEAGRVITGQDYAGTQWHYAYDEDGNCTEKQNVLEQVMRYEYDACCRLITVTAPEGLTRYTYDRVGRLLSISSPEDELLYIRDENDRVIREVSQGREIRRDYPDAFSVVRYPGAADDGLPLSTVFRCDRAGTRLWPWMV